MKIDIIHNHFECTNFFFELTKSQENDLFIKFCHM